MENIDGNYVVEVSLSNRKKVKFGSKYGELIEITRDLKVENGHEWYYYSTSDHIQGAFLKSQVVDVEIYKNK